jgi:hypothetical protein
MAKRLYLTAAVMLPTDPFDAAHVYETLAPSWLAFLEALKATGVEHETKADEMEARAKQVRRPRKPRLVTPPEAA